jgi:putative ABC transport system permease protein
MLRATLKSLLSRKLRLVLSGLAVVLATMFVTGAFVFTDSLGRSFDNLFSSAYDYTDIEVSAKPKYDSEAGPVADVVDASVVDQVAAVPGVTKATGTVFVDGARVVGKNGKVVATTGSPRFGAGWTGESDLLKLVDGRAPAADDEVVINKRLATLSGYGVGDRVTVLTLAPGQQFTVVGVLGYVGGRDSIGGEQTVAFTMPVAQRLMLGRPGVYSSIDVNVADKAALTSVRDALRGTLGDRYQVETGKDLAKKSSDSIKKVLSYFTYVLFGFAVVALLVGVFLILNTFSIIVAQRTQELALLRAMGASRAQMIWSVVLEALLVGVIASVIGLLVGLGLGALAAYAMGRLIGSLQVAGIVLPPVGATIALVLGIGVTVLAALIPAVRASRIPPVAAMQEAATASRPLTKVTVGGAVLLVLGGAGLAYGLSGRAKDATLGLILGGVLVTFIAVTLLTPLLSRPVVAVLGRIFSWSVPGKLGRLNSGRNPRRTAITAGAMMIGIALVTAVSTVFTSASLSIGRVVDKQLHADLIITGQQASAIPPTIDPAAITQIRALPAIQTLAVDAYDAAKVNGQPRFVGSWEDLGAARAVLDLEASQGDISRLADDEVIIDERTAKELGVRAGDTVRIQLPRTAEQLFRVRGVYADTQIADAVVVPWSVAGSGFRSSLPVQAFAKLAPGASVSRTKAQVDEILKNSPEVTVQTREDYVGQTTSVFNFILTGVQLLLGIAMLIAVLGIVNTLALSVLERTRELGMLRAIGLGRGQTMRMITVEAVVISLFGALLGLVVGAGLGAAIVRALRDRGFTDLALPWSLMIAYLVGAAVVGVIAALAPAIRASRLNVLGAIAYE